MRDDFYSKDWADNHLKLGNPIDKLFRGIDRMFGPLSAALFDAPWRHRGRMRHGASAR